MQRKERGRINIVDGSSLKIAVVVSRFNHDITGDLLGGAIKILRKNKVKDNNTEIIMVPGAFEIPIICQKLARTKKYHGIITLGCIIKGSTDHYYYVAKESIRGIMDVMLKFNIPIGLGVLTTDNLNQAIARSGTRNNKGAEATQAVLEIIKNLPD
jgi:6,7-dimethyl-8-ribityllumazine synthase